MQQHNEMDDKVDALYRKYLLKVINPSQKDDQSEEGSRARCYISVLLILRYLERISDRTHVMLVILFII
jgi:phosphate transport system protein